MSDMCIVHVHGTCCGFISSIQPLVFMCTAVIPDHARSLVWSRVTTAPFLESTGMSSWPWQRFPTFLISLHSLFSLCVRDRLADAQLTPGGWLWLLVFGYWCLVTGRCGVPAPGPSARVNHRAITGALAWPMTGDEVRVRHTGTDVLTGRLRSNAGVDPLRLIKVSSRNDQNLKTMTGVPWDACVWKLIAVWIVISVNRKVEKRLRMPLGNHLTRNNIMACIVLNLCENMVFFFY